MGGIHVAKVRFWGRKTKPGTQSANSSFEYCIWIIESLYLRSFIGETEKSNMKQGIHPEYREVIFHDTSSDTKFLTRSTQFSKETAKWEDGKEYPVIKVEVSSASHPFFTGKKLFVDTAGRVEKFQRKYGKKEA